MTIKAKSIFKNLSYSFLSNIIGLILSVILILFLPKIMGEKDYGYWQLYLFYITLGAWIQLGWVDGIYLRYAGLAYEEINKQKIITQFWLLISYECTLSLLIYLLFYFYINETDILYLISLVCVAEVILTAKSLLIYLLQITNRIKDYAIVNVMERFIVIIFLSLAFLYFPSINYKKLLMVDVISKMISLIYAVYICHDAVFGKYEKFFCGIKETYLNICVGSQLMIANMANIMIIGIVRWGISEKWSVEIFGKISLTLSICSFLMVFITAVSIVLFPVLKRTNHKNLSTIYNTIKNILMPFLFGAILIYYPLKTILIIWLPQYEDGLIYMTILFPICIYESKVSLLVNTYLKSLRQENLMFKINIITLLISLFSTYIAVFVLENLALSILSILILIVFRCLLAECFLEGLLNITPNKDCLMEGLLTVFFVSFSWYLDTWYALMGYCSMYCIYLYAKRNDILNSWRQIKQYVKK